MQQPASIRPIRPSTILAALAEVPPSILLGLSVRDPRLRDRSRYAQAETLADALERAAEPADPDQLALAL